MKKHAVHQLFEARLAQCTKPFNARGGSVERCRACRIDVNHCMCHLRPEAQSDAGFLLIYYDDEVLKPSNSGKLIADLFEDTYAYIWQRTDVDPELLAVLQDPKWFPMIVFPETYADPQRDVLNGPLSLPVGKRPLFILLDGSWREAKKMFRKSPYLDPFPVVSISPERQSTYMVRKAVKDHQLATAEVTAFVLEQLGEAYNAELLRAWFDVFSFRYQCGVLRTNRGDPLAESRLKTLIEDQSGSAAAADQ